MLQTFQIFNPSFSLIWKYENCHRLLTCELCAFPCLFSCSVYRSKNFRKRSCSRVKWKTFVSFCLFELTCGSGCFTANCSRSSSLLLSRVPVSNSAISENRCSGSFLLPPSLLFNPLLLTGPSIPSRRFSTGNWSELDLGSMENV